MTMTVTVTTNHFKYFGTPQTGGCSSSLGRAWPLVPKLLGICHFRTLVLSSALRDGLADSPNPIVRLGLAATLRSICQ